VGNIAEVLPELVRRGVVVDVVTDQTSAHDLRVGYIPLGLSLAEAAEQRVADPAGYESQVLDSMVVHVEAMRALKARGTIAFDYGNNLRGQVADHRGMSEAFEIPGFVPEYIRPLFCTGKGPFRWIALSGEPDDIRATDDAALEMFGADEDDQAAGDAAPARWLRLARDRVAFQGLPARILWLGSLRRGGALGNGWDHPLQVRALRLDGITG
jgi:urocanate hydratase